jgi:hypothetical protein
MADLTIKRNDTFPYLRGQAKDEEGPMDLTTADAIKVILSNGTSVIEGEVEVLDPPDAEGMNWQYKWAAGDTAEAGTYKTELEITWDEGTTPPEVETIPNSSYDEIVILEDLG